MSEELAFDQMADDLFSGLGLDATFIPKIGDRVLLKVHYDQMLDPQPGGYPGQYIGYQKTIEFIFDDIGKMPAGGDVFLIGSNRYIVEKPLEHDGRGRFIKVIVN